MNQNIQTLSHLYQCLVVALMTPVKALNESLDSYANRGGVMGLPLVLVGPPGIGKTAEIVNVAEALRLEHYTFPVDSIEIDDLSGVMVHLGNGKLKRSTDNRKVEEIIEIGEGVLFVDEINTSRGLDPALNRLVYEREFCKLPLPPGVRVLAAMNPPALSAGGRPLRPSLANRLCHLKVKAHSIHQWGSYIQGSYKPLVLDGEGIREALRDRWSVCREQAGMAALSYLHTRENNLHDLPKPETGKLSEAWASERTWHMAINAYATCKALGASEEVMSSLIQGCLGEAVASEWEIYLANTNLPSIDAVLNGEWRPREDQEVRSDMLYATVSGLVNRIQTQSITLEQANNLYLLGATQLENGNKDIYYPVISALLKKGYGISRANKEMKEVVLKVLGAYPIHIYQRDA